jgi:predicted HTH transcriptional regulator
MPAGPRTLCSARSDEVLGASMKTVCAFLNSEGGTLLIGVADSGLPKGLADDLEHFEDHQNVDGFELRFPTGAVEKRLP